MRRVIALVVLALTARGVTADWWSDFSNNLFTDLTPLIALFGEQPTKQFLSESLTLLDYFIFAMAPLGILTAVVSAIRVRGGPSVRAFIGRAQEGTGVSEAELCSSTSRDICELYVDGGIARVFGTTQMRLLELVHDPKAGGDDFIDTDERDATAGLYPTSEYFNGQQNEWEEDLRFCDTLLDRLRSIRWRRRNDSAQVTSPSQSQASGDTDTEADLDPPAKKTTFAPAPNLTLSVWMRRPHKALIWLAAIAGGILQTGVVVVAGVLTYHLRLETEDISSTGYGFPTMAAGTVLLCVGNFLCAFIVGESTRETTFVRKRKDRSKSDGRDSPPARMVWLQPGGQVVGDQTFDCFGYNDSHNPNPQYITSWKDASKSEGSGLVLLAIVLSTTGFAAQFVGLRGLHPLVSIAQLGAMLLMSAIRSSLRTQRLSKSFNLLDRCSEVLKGHELDWLTMHLELDSARPEKKSFIRDICGPDETGTAKRKPAFWIAGRAVEHPGTFLAERGFYAPRSTSKICVFGARAEANASSREFIFKGHRDYTPSGTTAPRDDMSSVPTAPRDDMSSAPTALRDDMSSAPTAPRDDMSSATTGPRDYMPTPVASISKILAYRTRLARLTSPSGFLKPRLELSAGFRNWGPEQVSCRNQAEILVSAIEKTANLIFEAETPFWNESWKWVTSLSWAVSCQSSAGNEPSDDTFWLSLSRQTAEDPWRLDVSVVEAVLGLWVMSLEVDPISGSYEDDQATNSISHKQRKISNEIIVAWSSSQEGRQPPLDPLFSNMHKWWLGERFRLTVPYARTLLFESQQNRTSFYSNSYSLWSQAYNPPTTDSSVPERPSTRLELHTATSKDGMEERQMYRFFGWNAFQTQPSGEVQVEVVPTSATLPDLCARELYASFIGTVLPMVDLGQGLVDIISYDSGFRVGHKLLEKTSEVFQNSGLGSEFEAALFTTPAMLRNRRAFPDQYQFLNLLQLKFRQLTEKEDWRQAADLYQEALGWFDDRGEGTLWLALSRVHHIAKAFFYAARRKGSSRSGVSSLQYFARQLKHSEDLDSIGLESGSFEEAMEKKKFGEALILLNGSDLERQRYKVPPLIRAVRHSLGEGEPALNEAENATILVEALLEAGSDPNAVDEHGRPALFLSIDREAVWAVESLLRHGAKPIDPKGQSVTALHDAAQRGNAKLLEVLLANKNMVEAMEGLSDPDKDSFFCYVHQSPELARDAMLKTIVECPRTRKLLCRWALRRLGKNEAVKVLQLGPLTASPFSFLDADILEAVVLRKAHESHPWSSEDLKEVLQVLGQHGFARGTSNAYSRVFLSAIIAEPQSTMELLLELNPNLLSCSGSLPKHGFLKSPLHAAIVAHDADKVKALLSRGASTALEKNLGTLLHLAVEATSEDLSEASPNARIDTLIEIIQLLAEKGVRRDATYGANGPTAWGIAREVRGVEGWDRVVEALDPKQDSPS